MYYVHLWCLWILFKSSVLAGLLWHCAWGKWGCGSCQLGSESPAPHSASIAIKAGEGLLVSAGWGWESRRPTGLPLTLVWLGGGTSLLLLKWSILSAWMAGAKPLLLEGGEISGVPLSSSDTGGERSRCLITPWKGWKPRLPTRNLLTP